IFQTPQREKRKIAEVIAMGHARGGEIVPNRGKRTKGKRVVKAIGRTGVLEDPIGKSGTENRREIAITDCVIPGQSRTKRQILLAVIPDRIEAVRRRHQETIHLAAVHLYASASVTVIRIG